MKSLLIALASIAATFSIFPRLQSAIAAGGQAQSEAIKVEVPATAGPRNPQKIATVRAGQKISVTIGHVLWKGGGSRTGNSTDWRGYRGRIERNALPWMALVFAVGKQTFLPDKREFTFTAPADGDLVAFANDSKPDGNSGKAELTVTISPQ